MTSLAEYRTSSTGQSAPQVCRSGRGCPTHLPQGHPGVVAQAAAAAAHQIWSRAGEVHAQGSRPKRDFCSRSGR